MNDKTQLFKGTLEGCILKIISDSVTYGYEISEKLKSSGFSDISEGTIYPLLLRLEKNGMIHAEYRDSPFGPKRKYYSLTTDGETGLRDFYQNWHSLQKSINTLFADFHTETHHENH